MSPLSLTTTSFYFWQIPVLSLLAILICNRRNVGQFDYLAFLSADRSQSPIGSIGPPPISQPFIRNSIVSLPENGQKAVGMTNVCM